MRRCIQRGLELRMSATANKPPASADPALGSPRAGLTEETARRTVLARIWGTVATALSVLYTAVLGLAAASAALLGYPHAVSSISRFWGRLILKTCGIKVEIEGLENLAGVGAYVLVSNHQSFFDIFAICAFMPGEPRFVAKQELEKIPVIGFAMRRSGHIFIDRDRGGQAIRNAIKIARDGYSIVVFAEGTRFSDNRVHPFNDGAAWLAIAARRHCVPMAISGSARFFPRGARIVRPGQTMRMVVGTPVDTSAMRSADREALTSRLEEAVRGLFRECA
jgi:1-acyl-sn-glycerol-3-phosphate acyltransferase